MPQATTGTVPARSQGPISRRSASGNGKTGLQLPGGEVLHVAAHPACTFDEAGRRSVEDAVWAASPLPYHGFERVFAREMRVTVRADGE